MAINIMVDDGLHSSVQYSLELQVHSPNGFVQNGPSLDSNSNKTPTVVDSFVRETNLLVQHGGFVRTVRLLSIKAICVLFVWYLFSFAALFLSKYILDSLQVDMILFSAIQLMVSAVMAQANFHQFFKTDSASVPKKEPVARPKDFYRSMFFVGLMRFLVVYLGLISMKYVALSFMETVKSSAPLFTVVISLLVLKERSGCFVQLSILPIMLGLILCSAYEISFTWIGFVAALGTNIAECLQFVLSKVSLSGISNKMSPNEFQLYTCLAALVAELPFSMFLTNYQTVIQTTPMMFFLMVVTGIFYYCQTMMAWILMEFLSPVTHSICNTVKCALAVWISVPIFGNHVTLWSGIGSCVVIIGVLLYNKARNYEKRLLRDSLAQNQMNTVEVDSIE